MNVKIFQGTDLREALAKVKLELGADAVILSTRQVKKGSGSFGIFSRPMVEVTAALDTEAGQNAGKRKSPRERDRSGNLARKGRKTEDTLKLNHIASVMAPLKEEISELRELIASSSGSTETGKMELKKAARLSDELDDMKSMFSFMLEESDFYKGLRLETNYLIVYRRMVERGIEHRYALKLVRKVKENAPGGKELDVRSIVSQVIENINEAMLTGDPIQAAPDGPRIASLIGPTGVGKTTTIAKIAANLMIEGKKVGLITIDTYRIAAVEQLKIYAGIMNAPIEVVVSPDDLLGAIKRLSTKDVILIDTAGRSQRDTEKLNELASFLGGDGLIENYLVLSAAADQQTLDESVRNFSCVPLSGLIFTKLDESTRPGTVVSQNFKTGLPIVYCTTGQRVPEDIETASPARLATWLFKKEPWEAAKVA